MDLSFGFLIAIEALSVATATVLLFEFGRIGRKRDELLAALDGHDMVTRATRRKWLGTLYIVTTALLTIAFPLFVLGQ